MVTAYVRCLKNKFDHILNDQPFHTWDAERWVMSDMKKIQTLNFETNPFTVSWIINRNVRKCIKLHIQFHNSHIRNHQAFENH